MPIEDILDETRAATATLCSKIDRGELSESDSAMLKFALDLLKVGGLGNALLCGAIVCSVADNYLEQPNHLH